MPAETVRLPTARQRPIPWRPQHVWIDRSVLDSPITAHVMQQLADVPSDVITGPPPVTPPGDQATLTHMAKKVLYLTAQQGRFVRACPGASSRNAAGQVCCGYMAVDLISHCNYDCTYCYLQSYVNTPYLTIYANIDQLFDEVGTVLRQRPHELVRLGSGEFSDSLSLEPLTGFARLLVPFLQQFSNVLFELKTKSDCVDTLLDLAPEGRVLVSWSLNPAAVVRREEHKTASLAARLRAAQRCRDAGYKIGLHFDPLLYYPGWEADYEPFVAEVFRAIAPHNVSYMSMGSLRFAPALKDVVRARFPNSRLMYEELVPAADGKMRYFKPLRTAMYATVASWIQRYAADVPLYLCMESPDVWHKTFGQVPADAAALERHIQCGASQPRATPTELIPVTSLQRPPRGAH